MHTGKTYAMLQEAKELTDMSNDVVVGYIENVEGLETIFKGVGMCSQSSVNAIFTRGRYRCYFSETSTYSID